MFDCTHPTQAGWNLARRGNVKGNSMTKVKTVLAGSAAILTLAFIAARCFALEGEVLEEGTNKPIAGAFVVAAWMGQAYNPVQSASVCYHAEIVTTNEKGRFRVSEFSGNLNPLIVQRDRLLDVYAPGYNVSPNSLFEAGKYFMTRRTGTKEEQFAQVKSASTYDCIDSLDRRLLPMYRASYQERASLAVTDKQKRTVISGTLWAIERIELGEAAAGKNLDLRIYKKQNIPEKLK